MKKIFFSALAALSLVACVQEAVVDTPQGEAIAFENAFVDNATRATLTANNLEEFKVYGIVNNTSGVVFDGTLVSKKDGAWKYDGVKYWIPGQDYYFAALAPVTTNWDLDTEAATTAGPGVLTFNNNGEEDLIYAKAYQPALSSGNPPVGFTFNHLLSKVKFSFTEGFEEEYINVNIKNITLAAPGTASIDLTQSTLSWAAYGTKVPYAYGELSGLSATAKATDDLFIIPGYPEYTITFDVVVWQTGEYGKKQVFKKNATVEGLTFEIGKAYNLTAAINPVTLALETIEFKVDEVEDWSNGGSTQIFPATPVATAEEFAQALEEGAENVVLTGDITLAGLETKASNAGLTITRDIVIDGNGHTLTYAGSGRAIDVPAGSDVNVTIKNVSLVLTNSYCERGINYNNAGTLILDNVKVSETGTAATYALNLPGSSDNCKVIIKDSYLRGNIALNVWGKNSTITAENSVFVSYDNTAAENYSAIVLNSNGSISAEGTVVTITGGEIIALDQNNEPSNAIRNGTATGIVEHSNTEITGMYSKPVAIVDYGTDQFYSCVTVQQAINKAIATNAVKVKLISDVELTEPVTVAEGKTVTLDLNGKTIKNTTESEEFGKGEGIIVYGNLTIIGEGSVEANTMAVWARGNNGAKVTINGGTYKGCAEGYAKGGRSVIYASSGNTINIYGGTFESLAADKTSYANQTEGVYAALNIADNNGYLNVYGGTFVGQNPAAPGTEPKAWNEAHPNGFVALGYKSTETNGVWTVEANPWNNDMDPTTYVGDVFASGEMKNALWINNFVFGEDAAIVVENMTYNAIIIENCSGNLKNDVLTIKNNNSSVLIMQNLDLTLAEGKKLIKSVNPYYQVFMTNIKINGEVMTQESIAKYLENVVWYQVVEEI